MKTDLVAWVRGNRNSGGVFRQKEKIDLVGVLVQAPHI